MQTDFIVIGSGLAGITSALTLANFGKVLVISKGKLTSGSSMLAQGGIAAVVSADDSASLHIVDTLSAGAKHNNRAAVEFLVKSGPRAIKWLELQGVKFDKNNGLYSLGKEAAHSQRRIVHISDFTGKNVLITLLKRAKSLKNITFWENCFFLDFLTKDQECLGIEIVKDNEVLQCFSKVVILATGGLGQIYKWTTNPLESTGDGIAAAVRAGAEIADLEFIQFHPTALKNGNSPLFLLSEALRGEGAYLINNNKERFMLNIHPLGELAPRDIVARAVSNEQKKGQVFLDIRHKGKIFLKKRFPNIFAELLRRGFDMSHDLIPITPAEHYSCGGVSVDTQGRTNIKNLFAFGEVSCTGVHGANRLASNSLLEAVVFPLTLKNSISDVLGQTLKYKNAPFPKRRYKNFIAYPDIKKELRELMWDYVGIIRTKKGLHTALSKLDLWKKQFNSIKEINQNFYEIKNMVITARLITSMALQRRQSLGAHYLVF